MLDVRHIAALDVGGGNACTPEEYAFLGALVRLTAPRTVVEIGTSTGIGTLVMAAALLDAGASPDGPPPLTTIDLPLGRATFADGLARNRAAVERSVPAVARLIDYRIGESHAVLDTLIAEGRQADLVFIDGGHSEAIVRGDWERALALQPRIVVLHDTIHLADVARVTGELAARYPGATITYPRRAFPGQDAPPPGTYGPGFTIFSDLTHVAAARAETARPLRPSAHEVASALVRDRVVTPAQARWLAPDAVVEPPPLRELEIVLSGRNDNYGGDDFHERMLTVAAFNHDRLVEAGVPHRFTLVEWNPPDGRSLIDRLRERLPWWDRSWIVSRAWHAWYQENPRLQFMEFFAKNAGIRRATGDWILTTNSDVFLGREVVERLAGRRLVPGTLYRASRFDLDRRMPRDGVTWDRLEDPRHLLRRNDPEPPYWNEAAGDFLLLDRDSWHRLGGFNERVRFTKIHKDSQFCLQAYHHGLALEWLGPVYHIDHDGSFVNTKHTYQPGFTDAPFGPDWDSWQPFWNREDWGVRNAIEDVEGATTWLRTPEEAGPALSLLLHGQGDVSARAAAIDGLLSQPGGFELLVIDPDAALARALAARAVDPRLRVIGEPDVAPGSSAGAALRAAGSCARGRHLMHLPGAVVVDDLPRIVQRVEAVSDAAPAVYVVEPASGPEGRALTIASRRAWDRLDGVDALSGDPVAEFGARARRTFGAAVIEGVAVRALPSLEAGGYDASVDAAWSSLGGREPVSALIAADLTRRGELLTAHLCDRLARELPPEAQDIAIFGVGPITPFAMAAVWALGKRVLGVYAAGADSRMACGGLTVQPASELNMTETVWVVAACASPGDVTALLDRAPVERTVHAAEPVSVRPAAPPFATGPAFAGLAYARASRAAGALQDAEAAYRALLRDPGFVDAVAARYELALVQEQLGYLREAEAGLRWVRRMWPEGRGTVLYNLGSFYERQGRWAAAERAFSRALALAPADDAARRGGCHYHLGEIALARQDHAAARDHFTRAVAALPSHGKARARLDALVTR